ncbi:MAG: thiamine pyrophosphate-binding protein [Betaproteobacteria bacterium]|nr:thiamine pyrophosphate-binding protein [Betaproteobacteria bacterium]
MAKINGAEAMVRMLQLHGVKHIFGLCGDTSLPFYDALATVDHGMRHILTRDERSAAYMADAYARVSGRVGVCEGPSGGGATYILPGIVEANESSIPVLGITTDISTTSRGRYTLTELDQKNLFRPLTKWNAVLDRADKIPETVRSAFRAMTTGRPGAAHLCFPFDVQKDVAVEPDDIWVQSEHTRYPAWRSGPDPEAVKAAATAILSARQPLFICGGGVVLAGAEAELTSVAERLEAPVATTISGQGSLPDAHPLCVGVIGSNGGTLPTRVVVEQADLVVFVGCRAGSVTTERWRFPSKSTRIVHIDVDPMVIGAIYRTEVALVGDAKLALGALDRELEHRVGDIRKGKGRALVAAARKQKYDAFNRLASGGETQVLPERLVAELHAVLPRDAVVVCDPGTPCPYFSAFYEFQEYGRHFISNRAHGALGYSMSAAVGAHFGRPQAKCVSVMGDGSFGFTAGEMETIVRLKVPLLMVVVSNSAYGWIKAGQKTGFGKRYYSVDFSRTDHARVADAFGVKAWRVTDPSDLRGALSAAAEHDGPTLVDVVTQPLHEAQAPVSEWVA